MFGSKVAKCFLGYVRLCRYKMSKLFSTMIYFKCHRANLNIRKVERKEIVNYNSRSREYLLAQDNAIFLVNAKHHDPKFHVRRLLPLPITQLPFFCCFAKFETSKQLKHWTRSAEQNRSPLVDPATLSREFSPK